MSWSDFERFALEVVGRLYEPHGIILRPTGAGADGGRDGEGTLSVGSVAAHAVSLTLWVEVKHHRRNVGRQQTGGHIFAAIGASANIIVIVSSSGFSSNFNTDLERFSMRTGIRYVLIDGPGLLDLAEAFRSRPGADAAGAVPQEPPSPALAPALQIQSLLFSATPSLRVEQASGWLPVFADTPMFAIVQFQFRSGSGCRDVEISLSSPMPGISFAAVTPKRVCRAGPVERLSSIFLLRAESAGEICAADLCLHLRVAAKSPGEEACELAARPPAQSGVAAQCIDILRPAIAYQPTADQAEARKGIGRLYERWRSNGGTASFSIEAAAGVGKSALLNECRWIWLKDGVREILLDGETETSVWSVFFAIFAYVLPVDTDLVASFNVTAFAKWLEAAGTDPDLAMRLARSICARKEGRNSFSPGELQNVLTVLLRRVTAQGPVAVVFEDLHKVGGSVLRLLQAARNTMRADARSKILFCFTSRFLPQPVPGENDLDAWAMERERLLGDEAAQRYRLDLPSRQDAEAILSTAIAHLYPEMADDIVERAGSTPFGLTEVIRYLQEAGVLLHDEAIQRLVLNHDADFRTALKDPALVRTTATDQRLALMTARLPLWGCDLLDLAACVGREFNIGTLLAHTSGEPPARRELDAMMGLLVQNGVLSPTHRAYGSDCRFEHDLIREAVLRRLASPDSRTRHLRLVNQLLREGGEWPEPVRLSLTYQSGDGDSFADQARDYAAALTATGYPYEAATYLALESAVLDPVAGAVAADDPAFRVVARPAARVRTSPAALLDVKRRLFETLSLVSGGSGEAAQRLISEVRMLAARVRDLNAAALAERWDGNLNISIGESRQAVRCFDKAEELYQADPGRRPKDMFEAVLGRGIALRLLGQPDESAAQLARALAFDPDDPRSQVRYHANIGALYFYTDPTLRRAHWQKALAIAKRAKIADLAVHMDLDLASLDILDGRLDDARSRLDRLIALATERRYENSLMRALVMASGLDLADGWPDSALARLDEARRLGYAHDAGRRMWKIHANSAIAYETLGELERVYHEDCAMLAVLKAVAWERRIALAPANVILRARSHSRDERLARLPERIPAEAREAVDAILKAIDTGAPISGAFPQEHLRKLPQGRRFIAI